MADIVLRDRNGNQVEYPGVESIKLNTVGAGTKEFIDPDTVPQAVEKTIDPDFSTGDMEVIPEDGTMFSKVTVQQPGNLIPGNIAEGVDIAGIVGTLASGGGLETGAKVVAKVVNRPNANDNNQFTVFSATELANAGIDLSSYSDNGEKYIIGLILPIAPLVNTSSSTDCYLKFQIRANKKIVPLNGFYSIDYRARPKDTSETLATFSSITIFNSTNGIFVSNGEICGKGLAYARQLYGTYLFIVVSQT